MTKVPQVRTGYWINGKGEKIPSAYVKVSIPYTWDWTDLVNGLGSEFFRDDPQADDESVCDRPDSLPDSITAAAILDICRAEHAAWGGNALWTWSDGMNEARRAYIEGWLKALIFEAFPEMKEYDQ